MMKQTMKRVNILKRKKLQKKELPSVKFENHVLNEQTLPDTMIPTPNEILVSISSKFQINLLVSTLMSKIINTVASCSKQMYHFFRYHWD